MATPRPLLPPPGSPTELAAELHEETLAAPLIEIEWEHLMRLCKPVTMWRVSSKRGNGETLVDESFVRGRGASDEDIAAGKFSTWLADYERQVSR